MFSTWSSLSTINSIKESSMHRPSTEYWWINRDIWCLTLTVSSASQKITMCHRHHSLQSLVELAEEPLGVIYWHCAYEPMTRIKKDAYKQGWVLVLQSGKTAWLLNMTNEYFVSFHFMMKVISSKWGNWMICVIYLRGTQNVFVKKIKCEQWVFVQALFETCLTGSYEEVLQWRTC